MFLEVPNPLTMDAFLGLGLGLGLGWVTGVVSDLLHWVVEIRGAWAVSSSGDGFWVGAVEVLDDLWWTGHVSSLHGREVLCFGFLSLVL